MTKQQIKQIFKEFYLKNDIAFDGRKHKYVVNGITCAGVSTIAGYKPSPFLVPWAAKMVAEFLADKQDKIKGLTPKQYLDLLEEAKKTYRRKSKEAADIGTIVHDWLEQYLKQENPPKPKGKEAQNAINQFLEFEKKYSVDWICLEKIVCDCKNNVAGRIDALAFVKDKLTLVDFKTSSQISDSFFLQTAGYSSCLAYMGIQVEQRIILRLPKKEEDSFEAILVPTDYEKDREAFLHQRYSWQYQGYLDVNFKEEKEVEVKGRKYKNKVFKDFRI